MTGSVACHATRRPVVGGDRQRGEVAGEDVTEHLCTSFKVIRYLEAIQLALRHMREA